MIPIQHKKTPVYKYIFYIGDHTDMKIHSIAFAKSTGGTGSQWTSHWQSTRHEHSTFVEA